MTRDLQMSIYSFLFETIKRERGANILKPEICIYEQKRMQKSEPPGLFMVPPTKTSNRAGSFVRLILKQERYLQAYNQYGAGLASKSFAKAIQTHLFLIRRLPFDQYPYCDVASKRFYLITIEKSNNSIFNPEFFRSVIVTTPQKTNFNLPSAKIFSICTMYRKVSNKYPHHCKKKQPQV